MGTSWSARLVGGDAAAARAIVQPVLDRIVREMSQWEPVSSLSRFNHAPAGHAQPLEPDFATVIAAALAVADASGGAFDPAMGTLSDAWGFGATGPRAAPPTDDAIAAAAWGHDALRWEPGARRLTKTRAVALDLAGIAKGHAVDAVADVLAAAGWRALLVEIGGEFAGRGLKPDGQPWWVDAEPAPGTVAMPLRLAASGVAVATSGDYRRGGHTLDPRTGRPIAHGTRAVTVVASRCVMADAWATALTVLPPDEAMAMADAQGLAARVVTDDGERLSSALEGMLT